MLLRQIAFDFFQTSLEFSSQWCSQKYCLGFLALLDYVSKPEIAICPSSVVRPSVRDTMSSEPNAQILSNFVVASSGQCT